MNRGKKTILLLIALALPIILVLLFEFDGKSVYEVPLLYEQGVTNRPTACSYNYPSPYIIPDSVTHKLFEGKPSLVIVSFDTTSREVKQNLNRVREQFSNDKVLIKEVDSKHNADYDIVKNCVLLVRGDSSIVLLDVTGRIRGYYNGAKREDVDRLLDEAKIVLKKY